MESMQTAMDVDYDHEKAYDSKQEMQHSIKKDVNSEKCLSNNCKEDTDLEIIEDNNNEIEGSINDSISMSRSRLPSYSISSSMNLSSILDINDSININQMNGNNHKDIQKCWNLFEEIRGNYLYDVENKMNEFKNTLTLWNEGGFIPLITNFMSVINDANKEIDNLSNRLNTNTIYIERFVKLYKKQQITLKNKTKNVNDIHFENNELKKENEWLRTQLLSLSNTMTNTSQQIKHLNDAHENNEKQFMEKLQQFESMQDNYDQIGCVTIFEDGNARKKRRISNKLSKNIRNKNTNQQQIRRRNCSNKSEKQIIKPIVSRSRSFRHSKIKPLRSKTPNTRRRQSVCNIRMNKSNANNNNSNSKSIAKRPINNRPGFNRDRPSSIPLQKRKITTSIRRPRASIRRLSCTNASNQS
eukprot:67594_1